MGVTLYTDALTGAELSPLSENKRPPAPLAAVSPPPVIDILLPSKERFGPRNAGAISGVVRDLVTASQTPDRFRVIGRPVDEPFDDITFTGIAPRRAWLHGQNIGLANAYLHHLRSHPAPDLVEVHSRCHVAMHIKAHRPDLRVALYLHNDPREMKGSRTTAERHRILEQMSAVICVSDYIRQCVLDGLQVPDELAQKVRTARNGVNRWLSKPSKKTKTILLVSRIVPEKGILEFASALGEVLPNAPDWEVVIAGARRFETGSKDSYQQAVENALAPLGSRAQMTGFLPLRDIRTLQEQAAIIACPSIWEEPMGKTIIEALAAGSALLTTRRGGIPEAAEGRAHIVDDPTVENFAAALTRLVTDDDYRTGLQRTAWRDFPFTASKMADDSDAIRMAAIGNPVSAAN